MSAALEFANLNDLKSATHVRNSLPGAKRILIVGAGFIGMEFAAAAATLGKQVTIVDQAARVLERASSVDVSLYLEQRQKSRGVEILTNTEIADVQRDGDSDYTVSLSNGMKINADMMVEAIGIVPRIELAKQANLLTDVGILADQELFTSDPKISAIGDCVQFPSLGKPDGMMVLTSVQNSTDQAKFVAKRLAGTRSPYSAVPWFWSDQADDKLQIVGLVPSKADRVVRRVKSDRKFSVFSFQNNVMVSVETLNLPAEHMVARRLLNANIPIRPEQIEDPGMELSAVLKNGIKSDE